MKNYDTAFQLSLAAARESGIAPVYFARFVAKNRDTGANEFLGFWSGDETITLDVENPTGGVQTRTYVGGCNLSVTGLKYVADLTDVPVTASLSQIADAAQQLVRGYDVRLAYVEIHATTWTGGALTSIPQLEWVGIVDDAPVTTPAAGSEGSIELTVRSEIMTMLTATNPAKSSNAHQNRRAAGDRFSRFSGVIASRRVQWYHRDD
ncbi:hypothetical protein RGQ15_07175 [Paracoccus sp. MBLB3053]|uniref:DUF2163 domain-containing protein n=1 Tax=Paracoccus aurantius TaxID=3073814 RepID=A0ABU2HS18_9RHOB|nr:hypothetical protein [Paracoccus sp. MBLB3053]MDS9467355.1 hypothetical protein [Paracoccus sp. MBLB3053]